MIQVLHASHNGELYKRRVLSVDDIADLIRETSLETLTNTAGIDFWFTPSTHRAHRRVNRSATELLLATTRFSASNVPLMRGIVVLEAHDGAGELAGLSDEQINGLPDTLRCLSWREDLVLSRRIARDQRSQLRASRTASKAEAASMSWMA